MPVADGSGVPHNTRRRAVKDENGRRARRGAPGLARAGDPARRPAPSGLFHRSEGMQPLIALSRAIDWLNDRVGRLLLWAVLVLTLISAGNALMRYGFNYSSNAYLEIQWYLYSLIFLGAAGYTLKHNAHVRIDLVAGRLSRRAQAWIDVFGFVFMMFPPCFLIAWYGWDFFMASWVEHEISGDAGGLVRWPVKLIVPVAFGLLILQGVSELIKRIGFLRGALADEAEHHVELEEHLKAIEESHPATGGRK
jgi:TRAP-type mannitol/chloroaromatic compound transport system permease small subunit